MNNGSRVHKMPLFCIENRRTEEDRHFAETCAEHFIHVAKQLNNFKHSPARVTEFEQQQTYTNKRKSHLYKTFPPDGIKFWT